MTDSVSITAAAGVMGTIPAVGIDLAALGGTGIGRLSAWLAAIENEQARPAGRLEGLGFTGPVGASPSGAGD